MDNQVMDNASEMNQTANEPVIQEKLIPQSQVNEIVGHAKREAAARAVDAYRQQNQASSPAYDSAPKQSYEQPSNRFMSEEDIKRLTGDEIKRHLRQLEQDAQERANVEAARRVIDQFGAKVLAGKDKFQDFESVTDNVGMQNYPHVVQLLAEQVDNTADVFYHLAQNRDKLFRLEGLSVHNYSDAIYEMKRLSQSIKDNDERASIKHPNAPLSQQRPSNNGTDSAGTLSMSDLKRKYRA